MARCCARLYTQGCMGFDSPHLQANPGPTYQTKLNHPNLKQMIAEAYYYVGSIRIPNWIAIGGAVLIAFLVWWFLFKGKKSN
jgi:hypothetical protein